MSHHGNHGSEAIANPGTYEIPAKLAKKFWIFLAIGLLSFGFLLQSGQASRAWSILLINHFFFTSIALGGLFLGAITWISGAMWTSPFRRIGEAFTSYLPVAILPMIGVIIGAHSLFHWSHHEVVVADHVLSAKKAYLNIPFFAIRCAAFFALWLWFARKFIGNSLKQDQTKDYGLTVSNKRWSPIFLILFAISYTFFAFDLLMSLDPHWFSTIFGVYCFAGLMYSTLALLAVVTIRLRNAGPLKQIINDNHIHDIGKFMFTFVVFWAYIGFSQFMLIWYANLPEETGYYLHRLEGKWFAISIFLLIGKFVVPFLALLQRGAKRAETRVYRVACWMLFMQFVDLVWMVRPEFNKMGPNIGIFEIGVTLGFVGLFGLTVARFFRSHNVVAIGDPRLPEAVFHHHQ